jgi:hypothetical protein
MAAGGGTSTVPAAAFQERMRLLNTIEQAVSGRDSATVTLIVSGDGGTGKTQLAAAIHARATSLDLRVWVSATSRAAILAAYAQAADLVQAAPGGDADSRAMAFLAWLAVTGKSWLVVLDDVAEPGNVHGLWPTGPSGRVLVTTRRRDAAMTGRGQVINVDVFLPAESSAYLRDRLSAGTGWPTGVLDQASDLASDVGQLPLALAQAAAVILDDGITCAAYRDLLGDRTRTLADLFPAASGDDYERTLAGVWSLALERADALAPAGQARPLLALAAAEEPQTRDTAPIRLVRLAVNRPKHRCGSLRSVLSRTGAAAAPTAAGFDVSPPQHPPEETSSEWAPTASAASPPPM